jgi:hypothetical protein
MTAPPTPIDSLACKEDCSISEADSDAPLCPVSRTIGLKVDLITVKALLKGSALRRLEGKNYRFCPEPNCDVVYFDCTSDSIFRKADVVVRVGQKELEDPIPVCYCFDFSVADLRRDFAARGDTAIPDQIAAEVRAGHCACEVKNPEGSCCLGHVWNAVKRIRSDIAGTTGQTRPPAAPGQATSTSDNP